MTSRAPDGNPSLWERIVALLEAGADAVRSLADTLTGQRGPDSVAFSVSFIALAAKLAKADGTVTLDEVRMFGRIFVIPADQARNVSRIYDLCSQETTGYVAYARRMARALRGMERGPELLEDVLDGLFHIAMADGDYHPGEDKFLEEVRCAFDVSEAAFHRLKARHVPGHSDPYAVLGVPPDASDAALRVARRAFVKDNHPDRLVARGLPAEMVDLAEARLADFNAAYDEVVQAR